MTLKGYSTYEIKIIDYYLDLFPNNRSPIRAKYRGCHREQSEFETSTQQRFWITNLTIMRSMALKTVKLYT